ncbi:ATP-dependent Clp protease ATP-binding subunit [Sutcliffiella rhizosphaerae]|uniref:ATP-dependent Clp protease ATP-binding subunit ClpE n=1 Tax=Sutcliffiella rhizosphaerae TaxID=2880967 RepID=A0ABN8A7E6_9BACI|nr:ATP-dependent Clp protease ATP-binding subunit [Sutcliffiella rhizosphaerae]CAG9620569.1 ATP-dependent Clp protease ATP-binding subunit ClpE [Sutcliffiella rhizosphaerae]
MKCQKCEINKATIQFRIQSNQDHKHLFLCHPCFEEISVDLKSPTPNGFLSGFPFNDGNEESNQQGFSKFEQQKTNKQHGGGSILDELGKNITNIAKTGLIDPVIGRDKEIKRVIEILNRRNKNNPVLIGEPGVGKTAIAEGLALKIVEGDVPSKLKNKEIYLLDVAALVANTGIRGQFEDRLKQVISELQKRKNIILFVDELHLIVGAGSAEGSMDAGNILKPALARGELQLIGATTLKEYRQIEKDAALERRFQPVLVKEPTTEEAFKILKGIQSKYEEFHHVSYSEDAIKACVQLSHRYIQDRFLPDKAIDLLDEAGSRKNLTLNTVNMEHIHSRLTEIEKEKQTALEKEDYEKAAALRDEEVILEQQRNSANDSSIYSAEVTVADIQSIMEEITGIPVGKLQQDEQDKLKNLELLLNKKVIGQHEAVKKVAKAIRRSRAGLKRKERPIGAFMFVGPTGVGKTELTKSLAEELFGTKDAYIRFDMSEFMEKHSVSKLIGSPPGYVGHDEAGQLTEKVRRNPYSIILLDEMEKAHPDVLNLFLQVMEDGRLTDSQGRTVSFKDSIIIMTSNAGVGDKKISVGFEKQSTKSKSITLDNLTTYFKPEFLNRFDSIIEFSPLEKEHLMEIVDIMMNELTSMLEEEHGFSIDLSEKAKEKLTELGYSPTYGARPLRRLIQEQIEDPLTDILLDEMVERSIHIDLEEDTIVVKTK